MVQFKFMDDSKKELQVFKDNTLQSNRKIAENKLVSIALYLKQFSGIRDHNPYLYLEQVVRPLADDLMFNRRKEELVIRDIMKLPDKPNCCTKGIDFRWQDSIDI